MPFLVQTADAASRTLWALYPDYLEPEYKDLRVLALHAHNAGLIHTREKPVRTMEDMAGLRLRTPSVAIAMMLEQLGASPVGMPPTQVYENLQKGVLDGTVFAWDAVYVFKLYEVLGYHLDARAYTTSFFFVMNERRYRGLPDDVRAVVDELSGEPLVAQFAAGWDRWDEPGLKASKERGDPIISLSDEERARWREALEPVIDRYLSEVESKGVENAREIYTKAQEYVAQFENREPSRNLHGEGKDAARAVRQHGRGVDQAVGTAGDAASHRRGTGDHRRHTCAQARRLHLLRDHRRGAVAGPRGGLSRDSLRLCDPEPRGG